MILTKNPIQIYSLQCNKLSKEIKYTGIKNIYRYKTKVNITEKITCSYYNDLEFIKIENINLGTCIFNMWMV